MSEAADLDRALKAKAILESQGFNEAFENVRKAIIDSIERCSLRDTQSAEHFRICLKLLRDVRLNLEAAVKGGKLAEFRMQQAEERKKRLGDRVRRVFGG